jgi:hypothetical protein
VKQWDKDAAPPRGFIFLHVKGCNGFVKGYFAGLFPVISKN